MCGIVGVFGSGAVNQDIYDALTVLQHRGQDAAGIATEDKGNFSFAKVMVSCVMFFIRVT